MPSCIWLDANNCFTLLGAGYFLHSFKVFPELFTWGEVQLLGNFFCFFFKSCFCARHAFSGVVLWLRLIIPHHWIKTFLSTHSTSAPGAVFPVQLLRTGIIPDSHYSFSPFQMVHSLGSWMHWSVLYWILKGTLCWSLGSLSVQLSAVWFCLLRNVADLVPGHSSFSFQLRASARLHLSFSSLNCTLENMWRKANWDHGRSHLTYF